MLVLYGANACVDMRAVVLLLSTYEDRHTTKLTEKPMPVGTSNSVIPGCGTHHIAVQTRDMDESLKLYREVLGMQIVAQFGSDERRVFLLDIGDGSHMELFDPLPDTVKLGAPAPNDPVMHFALTTTDTVAATEIVRSAGYTITVEPKTIDLGSMTVTIAFFDGPNGESIEFFQVHGG
jgi:catechol 2,3-dioxygenase-like lactoylglutathione lyase family enzyme